MTISSPVQKTLVKKYSTLWQRVHIKQILRLSEIKKTINSPAFFALIGLRILTEATFPTLGDEQRDHLVS